MKRLYKSNTNKMIDGVCGGVAEYLNLDPTIVRLVWVLLACMGGYGLVAYFIAMLIIPEKPKIIDAN